MYLILIDGNDTSENLGGCFYVTDYIGIDRSVTNWYNDHEFETEENKIASNLDIVENE